jgi:glucose/arabinose dehydrogenase
MQRLCFICLFACSAAPSAGPAQNTEDTSFDDGGGVPTSTETPTVDREEIHNLGGSTIWDMAFLPDGSLLYTVRGGQLRRLVIGEASSTVIANTGNALTGLLAEGQSGLMGLAIDPQFASNRRIYVYMTHQSGGQKDNRVIRFVLNEQNQLSERTDIVTGISYKAVATENGGPGAHSGGRLRFGPDGHLYLTTGDNHSATIPQDPEALGAKVLRFNTNGETVSGNPTIGSRKLIFAIGFRNPQGLAFHPSTGEVFISEHGPNQDDEVTRLVAGDNGGWNPIGANGDYIGYTGAAMTDLSVNGAVAPVWTHPDSQGMSACVFLRGTIWKAWTGRLAVGFLAAKKITVLSLDANRTGVSEQTAFPQVEDRVRSMVMGPDARLYVSTDSGRIFRYTPR